MPTPYLRQHPIYKNNIYSIFNKNLVSLIDDVDNLRINNVTTLHNTTFCRPCPSVSKGSNSFYETGSIPGSGVSSSFSSSKSSSPILENKTWPNKNTFNGQQQAGLRNVAFRISSRNSSVYSESESSLSRAPQTKINDSTRKAHACLDIVKIKRIQHWLDTGDYGINAERQALIACNVTIDNFGHSQKSIEEDKDLRGYVKIATFLTNFTSAYVIPITLAGQITTCIIDCGASQTLATSEYIAQCLGDNFRALLVQYTGSPFHAASGEHLNILGILNCSLQIGHLSWLEPIIVYCARHCEMLLGHNVLKKFSLLISPHALYVPLTTLQLHNAPQKCARLGTCTTPILILQSVHAHTLAPGQSESIECFVSKHHYDSVIIDTLNQFSWVAHSEDMQATSEPAQLYVYYQLIEFSANTTNVLFTNTLQECIYLQCNEEICHAEQMDCLAGPIVQRHGNDLMKCLYNTFQFPKLANTIPSVSHLFLNDEENTSPPIDFDKINCHDDDDMKQFFISFCKSIPQAFSKNKYDIGGTSDSEIMHFSVITGATPQNCKEIPTSPALLDRANEMIRTLFSRGLLAHSPPNNCWKAAMFFVLKRSALPGSDNNKKDGKKLPTDSSKLPVRAICDYRLLNKRLKKKYPVIQLPPLRSILDKLIHKKYITAIDLRQSFWHCRLSPQAQLLTGFGFNGQHYIATRLPHGITFSSQAFQSMLCRLLRKANLDQHVYPFVDDLIIGSVDPDTHKSVVTRLIKALNKANLKINFEKSNFANTKKIHLFGWELDIPNSAIKASPSKISQILAMSPPRTTRQARHFCGQFTHYNQAIPRIAAVLGPIFQLCSDRTPFHWSSDCQNAFNEALRLLGKAECLILPDFTSPFFLSSDAAKGQAASFSVWQRNKSTKLLQPIKHGSFVFKKAAKFYSQYKSEAMGICHGLQSSMIYFQFGTNYLITDVAAIQWVVRYKHASQQIYAWSTLLCSIDLHIIAVHNTSSVIKFNDAFCRPKAARESIRKYITYDDKKSIDLPLIDFSSAMPMPIQDLFEVIQKFQLFLNSHAPEVVKEKWKQFISSERNFINRSQLQLNIGTGYAIQAPNELTWKWVNRTAKLQDLSASQKQHFLQLEGMLMTYFPNMVLENLIQYQLDDPLCKRFLKDTKPPYYIIHRLLFKLIEDKYLLVWPKALTQVLVEKFHVFSKVYHLKRKKLLALLRQSFILQSYRKAFDQVFQNCTFCQLYSKGQHPRQVPLGMTLELSSCAQMWNIDYVIINSTFKEFPAILTVTDPFSAYTFFIPANDKWTDKKFISTLMTNVFQHLGFPQALGTDAQQSLISSRVNIWAQIMGIKLFQCASPTANCAERLHQACLAMFKMMNTLLPLSEQLMPSYACLATLVFNSIPTQPSGKSPHFLIFNGGPFSPNLGHIAPNCGYISPDNFEDFHVRFSKMKNIFHEIRKVHRQRNDKKMGQLKHFRARFAKGDVVLLIRKSFNTRVQHKLREKCYKTPFIIQKLLQKSCVLVPYLPEIQCQHKLKRRGKTFKSPQLIVPLTRCKLVPNPLPYLGLNISHKNILKLADIFKPHTTGFCRVILSSPVTQKPKMEVSDFFKLFTSPGLYLSDIQKKLILDNHRNYIKLANIRQGVPFKSPLQCCSIFTHEKFIQLKSTIHATCSYGNTSTFLRYHNDDENENHSCFERRQRRRRSCLQQGAVSYLKPPTRPAKDCLPNKSSAPSPLQRSTESLNKQKYSKFEKYLFKRRKILPSFVSIQKNAALSDTTSSSPLQVRIIPQQIMVQNFNDLVGSLNSTSTSTSNDNHDSDTEYFSGHSSGGSRISSSSNHNNHDQHDESFSTTLRHSEDNVDISLPGPSGLQKFKNRDNIDDETNDDHFSNDDQPIRTSNDDDNHNNDHDRVLTNEVTSDSSSRRSRSSDQSVRRRHMSSPIASERGILATPSFRASLSQSPPRNIFSGTSHILSSTPKSKRHRSSSPKRSHISSQKKSISKLTISIQHPENLISDSSVQSSGTPRHTMAHLPILSKATTKKSLKSSKKK